jgi:uncharacterized protein YbjT (DUF2867 family)
MHLVVGATGLVGSEICRRLAAEGKPVKALIRATSDPAKVDPLKNNGVICTVGDLKDRSSLDAACQGVTTVISTASATLSRQERDTLQTVDLEGQTHLVDAAKAAGVDHVVYISFSGNIDAEDPSPLTVAKRAVEGHLKQSGLTYTILRPTYFTEVWLSPALGFDFSQAKAQIYGAGQNPISWISFADVAQFAIACLDTPAAQNMVIELGGPEALSPLEVVKIFEDITGQPFTVAHVPEAALQAQKAAATDALQESFAALMLQYARGDAIDMEATLKTFPVQLASVRDYASRVLTTS